MSYLGRSAKLSLKAQEKVSFLATAGQTSKTGLSYTPSFVEVYVNGVLLTDTTDFTATNGNSITFTVALLLNDEVTVISLKTFTVADHYSKTEADTLLDAKLPLAGGTMTGNITGLTALDVTGTVTADGLVVDGAIALNDNAVLAANKNLYFNSLSGTSRAYLGYYLPTFEASLWNAGNGATKFGTNNTERMRIDSSGNVMAGKTSSGGNVRGCEFRSVGQGLFTNDSNWCLQVNRLTNTGAAVLFYQATTEVGNISVTGSSTSYNTSSDYRLKEADVPMTGATERVKALRPINFAWKVDGSRVDGFFAHELAEVVPEAATGTKDAMMDEEYEVTPAVLDDEGNETTAAVMGTRSVPDMQGIDQSKLVPLLTATIQELIARIEALEGE